MLCHVRSFAYDGTGTGPMLSLTETSRPARAFLTLIGVPLKRVHIFEFEDAPWFPSFLRRSITDLIVVTNRMFGVTTAIEGLVRRVHQETPLRRIVDLGSGAGGAMPEVVQRLREQDGLAIDLCLTDLFPNSEAVSRWGGGTVSGVHYVPHPVDATRCSEVPADLYTIVNSFHHMTPENARKMLQSAAESHTPLLVVEMADNRLPFAVWLTFLPLGILVNVVMALLFTLQIRPISWTRLLLTYGLRVIPILFAWDGQASYPRIYGFDDLDQLLSGLTSDEYAWEKGYAKTPSGKGMTIYLYGYPNHENARV